MASPLALRRVVEDLGKELTGVAKGYQSTRYQHSSLVTLQILAALPRPKSGQARGHDPIQWAAGRLHAVLALQDLSASAKEAASIDVFADAMALLPKISDRNTLMLTNLSSTRKRQPLNKIARQPGSPAAQQLDRQAGRPARRQAGRQAFNWSGLFIQALMS